MTATVLIVDDEAIGRDSLESLLLNQGYTLAFASSGAEALEQARALGPDLILLDVMMPGMNGYDVCRLLRADSLLAEVPIIMVTALEDRSARLAGIEAGADDFIIKPIDRAELRARVRSITRLNRYRSLQDERIKLEQQLRRLTALHTVDLAITGTVDPRIALDILVQQVLDQLNVDAAAVLVLNPHLQTLEYISDRGFLSPTRGNPRPPLGDALAGRAVVERRTNVVTNLQMRPPAGGRANFLQNEGFQTYYGVPLLAKGQVKGVLEVFLRSQHTADAGWLEFLEALAGQAAIALDNAQIFEGLQQSNTELRLAYDAMVEGWSRALQLHDRGNEGHAQRVTELTVRLARALGFSDADLVHVRRGALLHDVGQLGVPDHILHKTGELTGEELASLRRHPVHAYELLSPIAYLRRALDIPHYHHERWDGAGYPDGLKGEQIPLAARAFAVVDAWDALSVGRTYRPGLSLDQARAALQAEAGRQFDPHIVQVFLNELVPGGPG